MIDEIECHGAWFFFEIYGDKYISFKNCDFRESSSQRAALTILVVENTRRARTSE